MKGVFETIGPAGYGNYAIDWSGPEPQYERVDRAAERVLVPGFVDLHIHGAFGIDLMDLGQLGGDVGKQGLTRLASKLEDVGVEAFLPTTVSSSLSATLAAIDCVQADERILGFHLEGPFLSPKHPGAQALDKIIELPDGPSPWDEVLDHRLLRLVTIAPEIPRALDMILRLQKRGVRVSMGHTDATYEEARRGFEFGAGHVTHTFNAMRPFHHREPGIVGYALTNPDIFTEIIYDRIHVSYEAAKLLVQCKPRDRVIAVSDSTAAAGLPKGTQLTMWGQSCVVGRGDVRLENDGLAGSAQTLNEMYRHLADDFGRELALYACCLNPRRAIGMTRAPRIFVEFDTKLDFIGIRHRTTH